MNREMRAAYLEGWSVGKGLAGRDEREVMAGAGNPVVAGAAWQVGNAEAREQVKP